MEIKEAVYYFDVNGNRDLVVGKFQKHQLTMLANVYIVLCLPYFMNACTQTISFCEMSLMEYNEA